MRKFLMFSFMACHLGLSGQRAIIEGSVYQGQQPLPGAEIVVEGSPRGTTADEEGHFRLELPPGEYRLTAQFVGFSPRQRTLETEAGETYSLHFDLQPEINPLDEVVVSGTLKPVSRSESPVPVERYSARFLAQNPTPNLFEGVRQINGVRPQLNCNVCNTGDIHINGLEGPYTMVLIDGMPIVSGLGTVYGLMGIPNAMIERVEVIRGPASSLYGSEAVAGLINVITKMPDFAPVFSADLRASSWRELNADFGFKANLGQNRSVLTGLNLFDYSLPQDRNGDNFTDVTLQKRASFFQKWDLSRSERIFSLAARYLYEDRWGGEMQWTPDFRGSDEVYGESILTHRWELTGQYELPIEESVMLWFSYNDHDQDSYYGDEPYHGRQKIGFGQVTWDREVGRHSLLTGAALRYNFYDDNSPATAQARTTWLPGFFAQDEIRLNDEHKILLGARYDHHRDHGHIFTPRLAHKWSFNKHHALRLNAGTGFRVVNLFTEEHAALTGARDVVIVEDLNPERSYNVNLNYLRQWHLASGMYFSLDASAWHTYFSNQIIPDYDTDPNKIIYNNLDGHAVSQGLSLNLEAVFDWGLQARLGGSYLDVHVAETSESGRLDIRRPVLTEEWTATWSLSYAWAEIPLRVDYTGNLYGPMRLPLLGPLDPRDEYSPWWSLQNIQLTWTPRNKKWEFYGGVKNLLNYTPPANSIARAHDPFDRQVQFDASGQAQSTPENPNALTFDPTYMFAPNQGIRGFMGVRYRLDGN